MTKKKNKNAGRKRASVALRPPFSKKKLAKWVDSLPSGARIGVTTFTPSDKSPVKHLLEAVYWVDVADPS